MKKASKSPLSPLKILLVEDEPIVMMVNRMFLQELGYEPDIAETGKKALELSASNYDIIFMDIGLPDVDGISVTAEIREREKKNKKITRIVALTAFRISEVIEKCEAVGITEILNKPVTIEKLKTVIEKGN